MNKNPEVIRPVENPYSKTGGIAVLRGQPGARLLRGEALAPSRPEMLVPFRPGPRVRLRGGRHGGHHTAADIKDGDVVVIRYEGPKGGPGMREMLNPTSAIMGRASAARVALITDGRFSGATRGAAIGHVSPGSRRGRPDRARRGGRHASTIDIPANHSINVRPHRRGAGGPTQCRSGSPAPRASPPATSPAMRRSSPPATAARFWKSPARRSKNNMQKCPREAGSPPRALFCAISFHRKKERVSCCFTTSAKHFGPATG